MTIPFNFYSREFKHNHEEWISSGNVAVDPYVSALASDSSEATDEHMAYCHSARNETRSALHSLLKVFISFSLIPICKQWRKFIA